MQGRLFFTGEDSYLNQHIYPSLGDYLLSDGTKDVNGSTYELIKTWKSTGINKTVLSQNDKNDMPLYDPNKSFAVKFDGSLLKYGLTSNFNLKSTSVFIVYEFKHLGIVGGSVVNYPLRGSLFGAVHVDQRNSGGDWKKYKYYGRGIAIDQTGFYTVRDKYNQDTTAYNFVIFGVNNSDSDYSQNKLHNIRIIGNDINRYLLDGKEIVSEGGLNINATLENKKFVMSVHWNETGNSYLYVNGVLMILLKHKIMTVKDNHSYGFNLGCFSSNLSDAELKLAGHRGSIFEFSVDNRIMKDEDIKAIHTYLIKKHNVVT